MERSKKGQVVEYARVLIEIGTIWGFVEPQETILRKVGTGQDVVQRFLMPLH